MKDMRATRISATVFHKHKYITNPGVTPEYQVISTAGKLEAQIKGHMKNHINEMELYQLEQLWTILKQGWAHKDNEQQTPSITLPRQTRKVQVVLAQKVGSGVPITRILSTPHLLFKHPKGASLPTPEISSTATPPMVVPTPRVEQIVMPRRSPQLVSQTTKKENEEDAFSHNTRS